MSVFKYYDARRIWKLIFLIFAITAISVFLLISNNLVKELAQQERERMDIWAQATERLASAEVETDFEFLLNIISQNNSIPVMVVDASGHILEFRNFRLPDKGDEGKYSYADLSERNRQWLDGRLQTLTGRRPIAQAAAANDHFIAVTGVERARQYIVYEDSVLLKRLSLFPYIQLVVMLVMAGIIYWIFVYTKRAEQNRVWVGLSKETAHQLGTPISSLMAWVQYLEASGTDPAVVTEIDKDVKRLSMIAERFSKIGSMPKKQLEYLNETTARAMDYMKSRVSSRVDVTWTPSPDDAPVMLSTPLIGWVIENLIKNAVDAMDGVGSLNVTTGIDHETAFVEITDSGKGIPRKNWRNVFRPGFTTKKRGWGLGLTLAKRIIEEYHSGRIFVKQSEPGVGTTFRIELPIAK